MKMDTFEKLLVGLRRSGVDYILVGGLAVMLCGYTRTTMDVDILVRHNSNNLERMLRALEDFGEGSAQELEVEDFTLEEGAIRVVEDFPLDIFTQMSGHTYEDLLSLTDEHQVRGVKIHYLNPEGLILLKEDSLRPKDQLDVQALKSIQRGRDTD